VRGISTKSPVVTKHLGSANHQKMLKVREAEKDTNKARITLVFTK